MNISQKGIDFIKKEEAIVLHPYLDSAHIPTIGIGTIRYPDGRHVSMADPSITIQQAEQYLSHDLLPTVAAVNSLAGNVGLNQNQFDSLVSFAYNAGTGALKSSTLLKRIQANKNDPAIREAFGMWNKIHVEDSLKVSAGLTARRKREADLYFS